VRNAQLKLVLVIGWDRAWVSHFRCAKRSAQWVDTATPQNGSPTDHVTNWSSFWRSNGPRT